MNVDSFYIELQSNSKCFISNTVANFRNKISLQYQLQGKWDVALVEISYTYSWKNLPSSQYVSLKLPNEKVKYIIDNFKKIKAGYYDNSVQLVNEIQRKINEFKFDQTISYPTFQIDSINKLLYIKPGKDQEGNLLLPDFSSELTEILGLSNYNINTPKLSSKGFIVSERPPDLNTGLHTLFIYSDIVVPQYIGDIQAKLIKTVEVPNDLKFGDQVLIKYDNPHYVPLLFNEFESIEIDIKNDINERIPFLFGRTRVKLHLKKHE